MVLLAFSAGGFADDLPKVLATASETSHDTPALTSPGRVEPEPLGGQLDEPLSAMAPPMGPAHPGITSSPSVATDPALVFQDSSAVPGAMWSTRPEAWSIDGQTPYIQRFGAGYRFGDGPDFQESFSDLEWMIPIRGDAEFDNFFADLHFLVDNNAKITGNATLAYRRYLHGHNRIFGGYVFWDGTQTPLGNRLQQLGLGVESLGTWVDARANVYIPDRFEERAPLPNLFQGNNLIVNRAEVGMTGIDTEIGLNLPVVQNIRSRILGGGYSFDGQGTRSTFGWKVRGEAEINRQLWVDIGYQKDRIFGGSWNLGLVWRYSHRFLNDSPSPASMDHKYFRAEEGDATYDLSDRLSDPVRRMQHVVITQDPGEIATTPTDTPIHFLHVRNGAAGTGTIESPFGTLAAALAAPNAGSSIIYTPNGGTFNENVTLVDDAQLLSNGPVQTVTTQFGEQRLPFSGRHQNLAGLPKLTGNVTLANDATFSGFDVTGSVAGAAVTGFTVDNTVINNAAGDALSITGATASTLTNLQVTSGAGRGVSLDDSAATIKDLTVKSAAANGLEISTSAISRTVTVENLTVEAATGHAVDLQTTGLGDLTFTQAGTAAVKSTGDAFDAALEAGSSGDINLSLAKLTATSTAGTGINLDGSAGTGVLKVTALTDVAVTEAITGGFRANEVTFDGNATAPGNQLLNATSIRIGDSTNPSKVNNFGISLTGTSGSLTIGSLQVFNDAGAGLLVDNSGGGTLTLGSTAGLIDTLNGPALNLNKLTSALTLSSIKSTDSPVEGVLMDAVQGTLNITSTTLNQATGKAILIRNTPASMTANFGTTKIDSTVSTLQSDNVDTTTNNGTNLHLNFTTITITGP